MSQLKEIHEDDYYFSLIWRDGTISTSSKKTYVGALRFFQGPNIKKKVAINALLRKHSLYAPDPSSDSIHTQLVRISAILKIMRLLGLSNEQCLKTGWVKRQAKLLGLVKDMTENNQPSDKQRKSQLLWEDVIKTPSRYTIGSDEHLLLTLYIAFTRRQADYWKVQIHVGKKNGDPPLDHSFIHIGIKKPYIYLNDFKTVGTYGNFRADIAKDLLYSIQHSLARDPRQYLFCKEGAAFSNKNSYQKWSNRMLQNIFENKLVTVGTLRHSHATYINENRNITYRERKELAYSMAHSVDMQLRYMKIYNENSS